MKPKSAPWPFQKLHHVHLAVRDMAKAEALLSSLGIELTDYAHPGNFTAIEGIRLEPEVIHYRYAKIGDVHLQVMSPKDDRPSLHNAFLERHGNGVFSIGFVVDDVDAAEAEGLRLGLKIQQRGRHEDGWGFTYFDTEDTLGINLTVRQNPYSERGK
jgi:methylmalonyl-CoA/ethylmalonyl-CoA epimerase